MSVKRYSVSENVYEGIKAGAFMVVVLASDYDAQVNAGMLLFEENERLRKRIAELEAALRDAKDIIRVWHNMDGSSDVWDIYDQNAPEMKPINAALAKVDS